jgi:hypothetical protein
MGRRHGPEAARCAPADNACLGGSEGLQRRRGADLRKRCPRSEAGFRGRSDDQCRHHRIGKGLRRVRHQRWRSSQQRGARCGDDGSRTRTLDGAEILVSLGRTPNTAGTGLGKGGIELTEKGHIRVNDRLETTAPNVWAMGECAGSPYFTHVSEDDASVILENLNGGNRSTAPRLVRPAYSSIRNWRVSASMSPRRGKNVLPIGSRPCRSTPRGAPGRFRSTVDS